MRKVKIIDRCRLTMPLSMNGTMNEEIRDAYIGYYSQLENNNEESTMKMQF